MAPSADVLDDSETADADAQARIVRELRQLGVSVPALLDRLETMRDRDLLIRESRAQRREQQRRHDAAFCAAVVAAWRKYKPALATRDDAADIEDLYAALLDRVSSTERLLDGVPSAAEHARQRRGGSRRQRRIAPGASLAAIQQRFMPVVREIVWRAIVADLDDNGSIAEIRVNGRRVENEPGAAQLTAQFIRAFYPTWGPNTTGELVRKSTRRRKVPRSRPSK